jgi:1,4-alpha-glucan branching enzyme
MEQKTRKTQKQGMKKNESQRIERKYSKDKSKCHITFWLPREFAPEARCIDVAGSFNGWDQYSHLLNKLKNGEFSLVVEVEAGKEYEFRYFIDETRWENAWNADRYVWSDYVNCDNSVIVT